MPYIFAVVLKATITNEESSDIERVEKKLADRINQLLNKTSSRSAKLVQFVSLLGRGDIQILDAKWEYGLIVWFWCRSEKALKAIDDMNESSEEKLTKLMTELFKILLDGGDPIPEIINIDLEDPDKMLGEFCHCAKHVLSIDLSICGIYVEFLQHDYYSKVLLTKAQPKIKVLSR